MKVLNLGCAHAHRFEGWFASDDDFQSQFERGLVECPLCGSTDIVRLPTAPHLNVSKAREPQATPAAAAGAGAPGAVTVQTARLRAARPVIRPRAELGGPLAGEAPRL